MASARGGFIGSWFGSGNQNQPEPDQRQGNEGNDGNQKPKEDYLDPWNPPQDDTSQTNQQPQPQQTQQTSGEPAKKKTLDDISQELNLGGVMDMEKFVQAFQESDAKALYVEFNKALTNVYAKGIRDADSLIKESAEQTKSAAYNRYQGFDMARMAMSALEEKLPMAGEPRYQPMFSETLKRFWEQSGDMNKAIDNTVKYYKGFFSDLGKTMQHSGPDMHPGQMRGGFGPFEDNDNQPDYKKILAG